MADYAPIAAAAASSKPDAPLLLLVDDARIARATLQESLGKHGYQTLAAESGEQGLALLSQHAQRISAVVLDREMPGIGGLEVVRCMQADPRHAVIPVIMLTGTGTSEKIQEGIDAGVYYYLLKPVDNALLKSVIDSALRERNQSRSLLSELGRHGAALQMLHSFHLHFANLAQAEDAACLLAACFPDPARSVGGFMELFVNAIEHGNLGIGYEKKRELLAENRWRGEIDRRAQLLENKHKQIDILYQRKDGQCLAQISDAGEGFDWKQYWHINPARAASGHGRGIARARLTAFDSMSYNEKGTSVTVMSTMRAAEKTTGYAW